MSPQARNLLIQVNPHVRTQPKTRMRFGREMRQPHPFVGPIRRFLELHRNVSTRSVAPASAQVMTSRYSLLAGAALAFPLSSPAIAQSSATTPSDATAQSAAPVPTVAPSGDVTDPYADDEEAIVITGAKPRGSVVGDIPPENTLDSRDVRATGATNISELLDALAPQIGSAQGRGA